MLDLTLMGGQSQGLMGGQPDNQMSGMKLGGYQDSPDFAAAGEEGDGMLEWLKQKYPEMAELGAAEQIAFLKSKGVIGSGQYHGMGQANQLGMSQSQAPSMMAGGMGGLMNQASVTQQPKQQMQYGLMGNTQKNPWGLMGG